MSSSKVYVVCQTGRCQQTYPIEYFGEITEDTKNVKLAEVLKQEYAKA